MEGWQPLTHFSNTFRFLVRLVGPFGIYDHVYYIDWPACGTDPAVAASAFSLGWFAWVSLMASNSITTLPGTVTHLQSGAVAELKMGVKGDGQRWRTCVRAEETPCAYLLTGDLDPQGKRLIYCPWAPETWVRDGELTHEGMDGMTTWARIIANPFMPGNRFQVGHLLFFRGPDPFKPPGPTNQAMYRKVRHVRVLKWTDRLPLILL